MNIDQIIFLKLKHMILSHQGPSATGSLIKPKFPEALIVYYIDKMDGQLEMMQREISKDVNPDWTSRFNYFNQELWKK
jgi:3'-5' exoribonuclease